MLGKKLGSMVVMTSLFLMTTILASPALAEDWPVGVSCEVYDTFSGTKAEFSNVSIGPWVITARNLPRPGTYPLTLHVEANNQAQWGVIYFTDFEGKSNAVKYGPVATQEKFGLDAYGWKVECRHWPYLAG